MLGRKVIYVRCINCSYNDVANLIKKQFLFIQFVCLFDLILYVPSTIFLLNRDRSSWVEPVLSQDKCVLLKDHNTVTPVRLEPAALFIQEKIHASK